MRKLVRSDPRYAIIDRVVGAPRRDSAAIAPSGGYRGLPSWPLYTVDILEADGVVCYIYCTDLTHHDTYMWFRE
jgi:hypothetical protein